MGTPEKITPLDFEAPVVDMQKRVEELRALMNENPNEHIKEQVSLMEKSVQSITQDIYSSLNHWQITQVARHPQRPLAEDYIELIFDDFIEMHGDRSFRDDGAIISGTAKMDGKSIVIIAQQKGRSMEENIKRNFGMANPEGYRKALRVMKFAEKFNKPIITLIDTAGAFPGKGSEERGVAEAIARNLYEMSVLKVPVIACVIGEGGSGGALGIGVANRVLMMQYSIYSVISPESCASILWRDAEQKETAAKALKNSARDAVKFGIVDEIINEPIGGAHRNYEEAAANVKGAVAKHLAELLKLDSDKLIEQRREKFESMGIIA